jgi:hypothetical protein
MTWLSAMEYLCQKWPRICSTCRSWLITECVTRFTRRVSHLGSVASLLAATLYQGNPDRNHKLREIVSTERYIPHMQVLLECCYISMETSQCENWNHICCRKVSFLTSPHSQFRGIAQSMEQTYLYLWYHHSDVCIKLNGIDAINAITKPRII